MKITATRRFTSDKREFIEAMVSIHEAPKTKDTYQLFIKAPLTAGACSNKQLFLRASENTYKGVDSGTEINTPCTFFDEVNYLIEENEYLLPVWIPVRMATLTQGHLKEIKKVLTDNSFEYLKQLWMRYDHAADAYSYTIMKEYCSALTTDSVNPTKRDTMKDKIIETNTQAAQVAARIAAGRALNTAIAAKLTPQLPLMVRGYADTTIGRLVMANLAAALLKAYSEDERAHYAAEAMVESAMVKVTDEFDIEGLVKDLLDQVKLPTNAVQ